MKNVIYSLTLALFVTASLYAAERVYLGSFDFDYECREAAESAGYSNFSFSPLDGSCYGIK